MSLNNRWPPSCHQSGPSAGPIAPPNPVASSWIGSDNEMILSSFGSNCSMRVDDGARLPPDMTNPPVAMAISDAGWREMVGLAGMVLLPADRWQVRPVPLLPG